MKTLETTVNKYADVPTSQLPGWNNNYARAVITEDGLVMAYGDYYAARLGFCSVRHMLLAQTAGLAA